jgi:putative ABC transport system ATP-binding protein
MIKLQHIYKIYEDEHAKHDALNDINLEILEGECVLLRGHSGSGKSTLLSLIAGILKPTQGLLEVDGVSLSKVPDDAATLFRREHIGNIFQKYNLIEDLTVLDNIITPLIPTDLSYSDVLKLADEALEIANISHKKYNLAKKLSGGEQQRCAIARAIVNKPKIILADEPSANLDLNLTMEFIEEMKKLKSHNKTIIIASHDDLLFQSKIFTKIIVLDKGKISDIN